MNRFGRFPRSAPPQTDTLTVLADIYPSPALTDVWTDLAFDLFDRLGPRPEVYAASSAERSDLAGAFDAIAAGRRADGLGVEDL